VISIRPAASALPLTGVVQQEWRRALFQCFQRLLDVFLDFAIGRLLPPIVFLIDQIQ